MFRRLVVALVATGLVAAACTGSATVTQTGSPTSTPADEPTAQQTPDDAAEPTPATEPTSASEPTPAPEPTPVVPLSPAEFRTDAILGISNSGTHAYAGTSSPWVDETPCDAPAAESLSVVDIAAGAQGVVAGVAAGLEQTGDVRQFLPGPGSTAAILSSCGSLAAPVMWLHRAEVGADGRITSLGERMEIGGGGRDPYLTHWIDDDTIEARVIIEVDPDDAETWLVDRRRISMSTGETISVEQFGFFDNAGFTTELTLTTPAGFTYRVVDDPAEGVGCEGFGVARTLELETGGERRLALTQPSLVFSDVRDLHLAPTGHIAWTSGCEGYVSAFVGKVLDDGTIADAHLVETYTLSNSEFADYRYYRLTNDGFLAAVGLSFGAGNDDTRPEFLWYDLGTDPHFVNTAEPAPQINAEPLFDSVGGDGTWHVGDTLGPDPACGGRTLYGKTAGGYVRAFPAGQEVDAIVDVDLSETRTVAYEFGDDFVSRTVVVQTECPGSYEGRQVWFGLETDGILWGLYLEPADLGEVADVLAIRDVLQDGTDFVETSIVQVELLDGTVADVELVALPFQG